MLVQRLVLTIEGILEGLNLLVFAFESTLEGLVLLLELC
jgi:hypothetical protein